MKYAVCPVCKKEVDAVHNCLGVYIYANHLDEKGEPCRESGWRVYVSLSSNPMKE